MRLDGKIVLIAGGPGALGQTVTPAFAKSGARLITADRNPPPAQIAAGNAMKADVTDETAARRLVDDVIRTAGRIDVLVNLVGGFATSRVMETDASLWQRMLTMNLMSAFLLSKAVLPRMLERRAGRIVHVAARAAVEPFHGATASIVAKAWLATLVRTLALELTGSGVAVNGSYLLRLTLPPTVKVCPRPIPRSG